MTNLTEYAKQELERAGLLSEDSDYNGMLGKSALEIVEVFSKQGHSGNSAEVVTQLLEKLLRYEPLSPLTYAEDEWEDVSEQSGRPLWQNKRRFSVFSKDKGKTRYDLKGDSQVL